MKKAVLIIGLGEGGSWRRKIDRDSVLADLLALFNGGLGELLGAKKKEIASSELLRAQFGKELLTLRGQLREEIFFLLTCGGCSLGLYTKAELLDLEAEASSLAKP